MEKLSVYQILGYLIPGYGALFILNKIMVLVPEATFNSVALDQVVPVFIFSLIIGVIIHSIIDLLKPIGWFKGSMYKHPSEIITKNELVQTYPKILTVLQTEFKEISKLDLNFKDSYPLHLFDFAYYYLESKSSDSEIKALHGLYYLMRNLFFVAVVAALYFFILCLKSQFNDHFGECILFVTGGFGTYFSAIFIREKYICKTILVYYAERMHANRDKK